MSDVLATTTRVCGLELELRTDTQYATAYLDGRPFLTLQRRRVYETGPIWQAFTTDGAKAFDAWSSPGAVRRAEALAMVQRRANPLAELTPDSDGPAFRICG